MFDRTLQRAGVAMAQRQSRRSFLGLVGKGVVTLAAAPLAVVALDARRAEAHHICGHIADTDSCPHPYYPNTRIDSNGKPVHPDYGYPVDDDGRIYTSRSQKRRKICEKRVPDDYPFTAPTVLEGSWSRCCEGRIRRLVDCCSNSDTRINGDAALTGYCFNGRKVFCITYRDTRVSC